MRTFIYICLENVFYEINRGEDDIVIVCSIGLTVRLNISVIKRRILVII